MKKKPCSSCKGSGTVDITEPFPDMPSRLVECVGCFGTGAETKGILCSACEKDGFYEATMVGYSKETGRTLRWCDDCHKQRCKEECTHALKLACG